VKQFGELRDLRVGHAAVGLADVDERAPGLGGIGSHTANV
jgi:hypothetical protein